MGYNLGSFNIRDFNYGNKSSDGEELKRDFQLIADIIIKEKFDIVAIQEVNSESALNHLKDILNKKKNVNMEWAKDYSGKAASASETRDPEGYGFLWNIKRVKLLDIPGKVNPTFYKCAGAKTGLLRLPYYARFTTKGLLGGSYMELRVVNVHIKDAMKEEDRIKEFNTLIQQVLPRICDHQRFESMPAYTFLMGDYNLRLDKGERAEIRINGITSTNYTGKWRHYKTVQEEKTSLKLPKDQTEFNECYASNYDHFTYEMNLIEKMKLDSKRIEPLSKYFNEEETIVGKLASYRKKVSDHVPISLAINLTMK